MSKFKDFLKMNEAGAGYVPPTLTAGPEWRFPTSNDFHKPDSFTGMVRQQNYTEKPLLQALDTAQQLVQNIVAEPNLFGITNPRTQILGNPKLGGSISGLDYNKMITIGASRSLKFQPTGFNTLKTLGIFTLVPPTGTTPQTVTIDLGQLYKVMQKEIKQDTGKETIAGELDKGMNALTTGLTTAKSTQAPGRKQYGGV